MKVTENLVTKDHSKLVSAILADQVNRAFLIYIVHGLLKIY